MKIEILSPRAISFPTPIRIEVGSTPEPDGAFVLRAQSGKAVFFAQKVGNAIIAILDELPAREKIAFDAVPSTPDANISGGGVSLRETENSLEVHLPQGMLGTYHFGEEAARPFVWPLHGPGQTPMTRAFPMQGVDGESDDHPHHTSLWSAFDEVNEINNWHNAPGHGRTRHQSFSDLFSGPVCGGFTAHSIWESAEGKPALDETKTLCAYNAGDATRVFDYEIILKASYGDAHFGDTKEGGIIALRVATSMDGERGGIISNSENGKTESECWGKRAAWCDYAGKVGNEIVGAAIFDHPQNPNFPTRWHVRDYGLFAANPFSTAAFGAGAATPFILQNGQAARFRYRVLLHRGNAEEARVGEFFAAWSEPPTSGVLQA